MPDENLADSLLDAVHFEILWLINKSDYYGALHHEDKTRIAQRGAGTCSTRNHSLRWFLGVVGSDRCERLVRPHGFREYEQLHGARALRRDVIACASTAQPIDIGSPHGPVHAVALDELDAVRDADGLIHLAFLTRDRVAAVGLERYIAVNREITARVATCIDRHPGMPILTTSSGAAAVFDGAEVDLKGNPYAALKQETALTTRGVMATVFRVYAASGRFTGIRGVCVERLPKSGTGWRADRDPQRAAGARSYVHVGTMMRSLADRARQVDAALQWCRWLSWRRRSASLSLPEPCMRINTSLAADDYRADSGPFMELLRHTGSPRRPGSNSRRPRGTWRPAGAFCLVIFGGCRQLIRVGCMPGSRQLPEDPYPRCSPNSPGPVSRTNKLLQWPAGSPRLNGSVASTQ